MLLRGLVPGQDNLIRSRFVCHSSMAALKLVCFVWCLADAFGGRLAIEFVIFLCLRRRTFLLEKIETAGLQPQRQPIECYPRLRIVLGIIDNDAHFQVFGVHPVISFDDVQRAAVRTARIVEPGLVVIAI